MGLHIRDERQRKALTGLSQAPFDRWLPFFRALYETTQPQAYAAGGASGTRRRKPGGEAQGNLPTMAETLPFVLYSEKTYPPFDVLGTQCEMARAKAHDQLPQFAPMLSDTLGHLDLIPSRAWSTPEA